MVSSETYLGVLFDFMLCFRLLSLDLVSVRHQLVLLTADVILSSVTFVLFCDYFFCYSFCAAVFSLHASRCSNHQGLLKLRSVLARMQFVPVFLTNRIP